MITVRQIERLWDAKSYGQLRQELSVARLDAHPFATDSRPAAAALAVIRLDELVQAHVKLYPALIRAILSSQEADGGWGDPLITSLCLRALLCGHGNGPAIDRGMAYLANLQKEDGSWPNGPIRRMPADAAVTARVLYELGDQPRFRKAVRVADALRWLRDNELQLDPDTRRLSQSVKLRCQQSGEHLLQPTLC